MQRMHVITSGQLAIAYYTTSARSDHRPPRGPINTSHCRLVDVGLPILTRDSEVEPSVNVKRDEAAPRRRLRLQQQRGMQVLHV